MDQAVHTITSKKFVLNRLGVLVPDKQNGAPLKVMSPGLITMIFYLKIIGAIILVVVIFYEYFKIFDLRILILLILIIAISAIISNLGTKSLKELTFTSNSSVILKDYSDNVIEVPLPQIQIIETISPSLLRFVYFIKLKNKKFNFKPSSELSSYISTLPQYKNRTGQYILIYVISAIVIVIVLKALIYK